MIGAGEPTSTGINANKLRCNEGNEQIVKVPGTVLSFQRIWTERMSRDERRSLFDKAFSIKRPSSSSSQTLHQSPWQHRDADNQQFVCRPLAKRCLVNRCWRRFSATVRGVFQCDLQAAFSVLHPHLSTSACCRVTDSASGMREGRNVTKTKMYCEERMLTCLLSIRTGSAVLIL